MLPSSERLSYVDLVIVPGTHRLECISWSLFLIGSPPSFSIALL